MPVKGSRPCAAKCRTKNGGPCMQPAMRESNRCRMHFGHARELRTHGRLTIPARQERKQQRTLLKEMKRMANDLSNIKEWM